MERVFLHGLVWRGVSKYVRTVLERAESSIGGVCISSLCGMMFLENQILYVAYKVLGFPSIYYLRILGIKNTSIQILSSTLLYLTDWYTSKIRTDRIFVAGIFSRRCHAGSL